MTTATSVKLSDETAAKLERLAARTGRSKSYYLREAVETHINHLVQEYEILETSQNVRSGRERTYTLAEVEKILDLGD